MRKRHGGVLGIAQPLHTLHLYGAAGVASFGWALSRLLAFPCDRLLPLWFFGALLVYNLDRLKHDPADALNTPERLRQHGRLRAVSIALVVISALLLVALPVLADDPLLLLLTAAAALVSLSYSFQLFGFRCKDLPAIKTLFAPTIVLGAYLLPSWIRGALPLDAHFASAAAWSLCLLMFNMVLCDLRDIVGDRAVGTKSIPVLLGEKSTRRLLLVLLGLQFILALANGWVLLGCLSVIYLAALLLAIRTRQREGFYEWFVEGILFLPAVTEAWKHFAG